MSEKESKKRILDAAAELFGERGKSETSAAQIACEAGVNKALIFYYFGSKEGLYRAAFKKWFGELIESIREKTEGVEPGLPMIEAFVRAHIGYLQERPGLVKIIIRELLANDSGPSPAIAEIMASFRSFAHMMVESMEIAKARGEIRDVDSLQTVVNIISMDVFIFLGQPIVNLIAPDVNTRAFVDDRVNHVLDLLMNGLRLKPE